MVYESRQEDEDSFAVDLQTGTKLPLEHLTADTLIGPSKAGRIVYDDYDLNNWVVVGLADGVKTISVVKVNNAMPIDWAGERLVLGGDRLQLLDMENGDIESVISDADFSKIGNAIDWPSKLNWSGYSPYHIVPSPDLTQFGIGRKWGACAFSCFMGFEKCSRVGSTFVGRHLEFSQMVAGWRRRDIERSAVYLLRYEAVRQYPG